MFDVVAWLGENPWRWVWLAWGQLLLAYLGYVIYLMRRAQRLQADKESA